MPDPDGDLKVSEIEPNKIIEVPDSAFAHEKDQTFKTISHSWARKDIFPHVPEIDDVRQIRIGDCFLLAALHSIVQVNPALITGAMRDLRGGWVVVRLYDKKGDPLYYKIEKTYLVTDPGFLQTNTDLQGHNAFWVYLLEKAYACFRLNIEKHEVTPKEWVKKDGRLQLKEGKRRPAVTYVEALSGGHSHNALQTLLGGQKLKIDLSIEGSESVAAAILHRMIMCRSLADMTESDKAAFKAVFGGLDSTAAPEFIGQFAISKMIKYMGLTCSYKVLRRDPLEKFFKTEYLGLSGASMEFVLAFVRTHFPGRRGTGLYTATQLELFDVIQRHARAAEQLHRDRLGQQPRPCQERRAGPDERAQGQGPGRTAWLSGGRRSGVLQPEPEVPPGAQPMARIRARL